MASKLTRMNRPSYTGRGGVQLGIPTENTPLNGRMRLFIKFIAMGHDRSTAVTMAGYSCKAKAKFGWELLQLPHVQKGLREEQARLAEEQQMTRKKVMDGFLAAIEQAKTTSDPSAQIQGWNSIAKMCGFFEPTKHKIEVSVNGKVVVEKLQTMSDDDLVRLAEGNTEVIEGEVIDIKALNQPTQSHGDGKLDSE